MNHIVLLGDSIFDNKSYVGDGLDVVSHLRQLMPSDGKATLRAIDGSVLANVHQQITSLPKDVTHLVVSAGGNDAILNADVLQMKTFSSAEVFSTIADRVRTFENQYHEMLQAVLSLNKPTIVSTIYYPRFPEAFAQKISVAALATFNDVIIRQAILAGVPLMDLRLICTEDSDYANEIEPSDAGGFKIAKAILRIVKEHDFPKRRTEAYF